MKNRPLVYGLIALAFFAFAWRISHPPKPPVPGPMGSPTHWSSSSAIGDFVGLQARPDGTEVASIWVESKPNSKPRSGLRILKTQANVQTALLLPDGFEAQGVSWKGNNIVTAGNMPDHKFRVIQVDPSTQEYKTLSDSDTQIDNVLSWPIDSQYLLTENITNDGITVAALDDKGTQFGKPVSILNSSTLRWNQTNVISREGSCAVLSVLSNTDPSGFPHYYFCDFLTGKALLISNKLPGRVQSILVSRTGVLFICILRGQCSFVFYNPLDSKLEVLKSVPVSWAPASTWPDIDGYIIVFSNDAALQLDLSTLSITKLVSFKDVDSTDSIWRTLVPGAHGVVMTSGDILSFNLDAGEPDIRRFTKVSGKKYSMVTILPRQ